MCICTCPYHIKCHIFIYDSGYTIWLNFNSVYVPVFLSSNLIRCSFYSFFVLLLNMAIKNKSILYCTGNNLAGKESDKHWNKKHKYYKCLSQSWILNKVMKCLLTCETLYEYMHWTALKTGIILWCDTQLLSLERVLRVANGAMGWSVECDCGICWSYT